MNPRTSVRVHEAQTADSHLKQTAILTTASLLTILFMTLHLTGDILFKMSPAGFINLLAVFIFVGQLYGMLVLGESRAGYIHHPLRVCSRAGRPYCPYERAAGSYRLGHRRLRPTFPFRVDNARVGHHLDVLHHPGGARTVELAETPEPARCNCCMTPVADIFRERPLSFSVTFTGGNWFRRHLAMHGKELRPPLFPGV
jgi:hypothetical protein